MARCVIFGGGGGGVILNRKGCWDIKISWKSSVHIIVTTPLGAINDVSHLVAS